MRRKHHCQKYSQLSFIRTLTSLSEYTIEFLLSRPEEFCSDITVYRAGVADKLECLELMKRDCVHWVIFED